jgi:anti-anti-sigma regulatory factor
VSYAGPADPGAARAHLAGVGDLDRLLADGAVRIRSAEDVYGAGRPVDPERLVEDHAVATEAALADGFRGLAVSADATELVRTPEQQDALARYEFLVDRYMADHPMPGLCGYRLDLGDATVAEFASLHTTGAARRTALRVFGCPDGALGLRGDADPVGVAALRRLLPRLRVGAGTGDLVVDLAGVEHVDHRLLLALSDHARARGATLTLRSPSPFAVRLVDLLQVPVLQHAEGGLGT